MDTTSLAKYSLTTAAKLIKEIRKRPEELTQLCQDMPNIEAAHQTKELAKALDELMLEYDNLVDYLNDVAPDAAEDVAAYGTIRNPHAQHG